MGLGPIYDAGYTVTFDDAPVTIRDRDDHIVLSGWCDAKGSRLWCINLLLTGKQVATHTANAVHAPLTAYSAYDLPSVGALVR